MGILDDAIRQHLELKRTLGADDDELKLLEDEAFGPPARPGDPDFPDSEAPDSGEEGAGTDVGEVDARPEAASGIFDHATDEAAIPAAEAQEAPAAPAPEAPLEEHEPAPNAVPEPEVSAEAPEPEVSAEAPEPEVAAEAPESPPAAEPASDPEPASDELDLGDLDLEIEDAELPPLDPNPPIESLETAEHQVELDTVEHPPPAEPVTGEEDEVAEDDDVLADTPEFLRDAPEDDDLWFEQGQPKDFDFDE